MSVILELKVIPQSGRQQFMLDKSGSIKCFIKSAPEGGLANVEIIKFLSKILHIPQDHIKILQGATARKKVLKLECNLDKTMVFHKLGLGVQTTL